MSATLEHGDAELVLQSRAGDQDAFGRIVARYQALICSLAYSATGNLSRSEDLAQETFLTAWKELHALREPNRLRSWLCGIARNLISNTFRQQAHEPVHSAGPLEAAHDAPSPERLPFEQAISREEESILWRSLERIPSLYREPLILFYREHQSVERVAEALELSPDAVKQRLARGRRMLQEEVTAFVEGALQRTTPGKAFTLGVLAALPIFAAGSATAATVGATAAKASTAAKAAMAAGLTGAVLGPILGLLGGVCGAWASIKNTRSPRERRFMIRQTFFFAAYTLLFTATLLALDFCGRPPLVVSHPVTYFCVLGVLVVGYCAGVILWSIKINRRQRQIRIEDGTAEAPSPLLPQFLGRKQRLWNVYGSLGGGTVGALAWIVIQAAQVEDWITVPVTVLFGAAVVLFGGRALMRRPERRYRVLVQTLVLLGLFTLTVSALHWRDWMKATGMEATAGQGILLGTELVAYCALIGGILWFRRKQLRSKKGNKTENDRFLMVLIPLLTLFGVNCQSAAADPPRTESRTLPNHIRLVSVYFPHSTNMAIFTYVPMGLVSDGPRQAQWSHLVEHLVLRSTIPKGLSMANAETLPDHMRLDFYGNVGNWKEGLSHHRRWLEGVPFTEASLEAEKPKVKSECDYTAKRFATHKFALAAWAQGFRHGQTHAAVQGDIDRVRLSDIQAYRDGRLAVLSNVLVCVVGGVEPAKVLPMVSDQLGDVKSSAKPAAAVQLHSGNREMTWDLNARHLVLTWPIPAFESEDFPALLAAAQWLNVQFFSDAKVKQTTGMAVAGADLATPEGNFFYVSASLRPGSPFNEVQERLKQYVRYLSSTDRDLSLLPMLGRQLAESLTKLPDPAAMKGQLPPNFTMGMLEMNLGLQWGMNEFRYGTQKLVLARRLSELNDKDIRRAAEKYLLDSKCSAIRLQPSAH